MIIELGHFALCLAFVAALVQSTVPLWGMRTGSAAGMCDARNGRPASWWGFHRTGCRCRSSRWRKAATG